jgi:hypothetical protein
MAPNLQGTRWKYRGGGDCPEGTIHTVVQSGKNEIITWSDPVALAGSPDAGGFSWMSDRATFFKRFSPIAAQ